MAMITENIKVTGMSCGHCKKFVTNTITDLEGINNVEVDLEKQNATVSYDDSKVTRNEIVDAVNATQTYHAE
jgi:copper ion binding protein